MAQLATAKNLNTAANQGSPLFDDRPLTSTEVTEAKKVGTNYNGKVGTAAYAVALAAFTAARVRGWVPGERLPRGKQFGKRWADAADVDPSVVTRALQAMTWWLRDYRKTSVDNTPEAIVELRPTDMDEAKRFNLFYHKGETAYDRKFGENQELRGSTQDPDEKRANAKKRAISAIRSCANNGMSFEQCLDIVHAVFKDVPEVDEATTEKIEEATLSLSSALSDLID